MDAQIGFSDALRRAFPTTVSRVSRVSWLDPPGDFVRPKFSNICFEAIRGLSICWEQTPGHKSCACSISVTNGFCYRGRLVTHRSP